MSDDNESTSQKRDLRFYNENAYGDLGDASVLNQYDPTLDVARLIGADGERLQPIAEDWNHTGVDPATYVIVDSLQLHETDSTEYLEDGARTILEHLVERKAPEAAESFRWAVTQLIEPVRSVAISRFYAGRDSETTARILRTSVETVDFLSQVALMYLEPVVEFKPAHVRTPSSYEGRGPGKFERAIDVPADRRSDPWYTYNKVNDADV